MKAYNNLTMTQIKDLLTNGTLVALIYADAGLQSYSSGVYSGCPAFANSFASINHAV
jgi:hypothetical protein